MHQPLRTATSPTAGERQQLLAENRAAGIDEDGNPLSKAQLEANAAEDRALEAYQAEARALEAKTGPPPVDFSPQQLGQLRGIFAEQVSHLYADLETEIPRLVLSIAEGGPASTTTSANTEPATNGKQSAAAQPPRVAFSAAGALAAAAAKPKPKPTAAEARAAKHKTLVEKEFAREPHGGPNSFGEPRVPFGFPNLPGAGPPKPPAGYHGEAAPDFDEPDVIPYSGAFKLPLRNIQAEDYSARVLDEDDLPDVITGAEKLPKSAKSELSYSFWAAGRLKDSLTAHENGASLMSEAHYTNLSEVFEVLEQRITVLEQVALSLVGKGEHSVQYWYGRGDRLANESRRTPVRGLLGERHAQDAKWLQYAESKAEATAEAGRKAKARTSKTRE